MGMFSDSLYVKWAGLSSTADLMSATASNDSPVVIGVYLALVWISFLKFEWSYCYFRTDGSCMAYSVAIGVMWSGMVPSPGDTLKPRVRSIIYRCQIASTWVGGRAL